MRRKKKPAKKVTKGATKGPKKKVIKTLDGSKVKNAKKSVFDGLSFDSNLELFTYKALKANGIHNFGRESWTVTLIEPFIFSGIATEAHLKTIKGTKKRQVVLGQVTNKIRPMTYTPDFVCINEKKQGWVIECKGWGNDSYPIKRKMFKQYLTKNGFVVDFFEPNDQKNVLLCVEMIKNKYYGSTTS